MSSRFWRPEVREKEEEVPHVRGRKRRRQLIERPKLVPHRHALVAEHHDSRMSSLLFESAVMNPAEVSGVAGKNRAVMFGGERQLLFVRESPAIDIGYGEAVEAPCSRTGYHGHVEAVLVEVQPQHSNCYTTGPVVPFGYLAARASPSTRSCSSSASIFSRFAR